MRAVFEMVFMLTLFLWSFPKISLISKNVEILNEHIQVFQNELKKYTDMGRERAHSFFWKQSVEKKKNIDLEQLKKDAKITYENVEKTIIDFEKDLSNLQ